MEYKKLVEQIKRGRFEDADESDLQRLMVLSTFSAVEFGESLRLALRLYPDNEALQKMASEELRTNNLVFEDYTIKGDHAEFLLHFDQKNRLREKFPGLTSVGLKYHFGVAALGNEIRVMSIVSREQELPGIFSRILEAKKWDAPGLPAFRYYLERHISLDSQEGGHADMLKDMPVDDRVAAFYRARLQMYQEGLPRLFDGGN